MLSASRRFPAYPNKRALVLVRTESERDLEDTRSVNQTKHLVAWIICPRDVRISVSYRQGGALTTENVHHQNEK
jgi:hypothetical protein